MERLELNHFKAFQNNIVLESPGNKNILLYGENGAGKSSFFSGIQYVFYRDRIEAVDALLPPADKQAQIEAIRQEYKNNSSADPFSIKFNGIDLYEVNTAPYQVFMLSRFNKVNQITLCEVLSNPVMPINVESFVEQNHNFIIENVNDELTKTFLEPIVVSIVDNTNGYVLVLKNKETGLSRSQDLNQCFNEAIINLVQLLIWFSSVQLMADYNKTKIIVLDDFITSLDASNRSVMMRYIFKTFRNYQLLIFTHDYSLFNIASYIIRYVVDHENGKWKYFKLYSGVNGNTIVSVERLNAKTLSDEYESPGCNYDDLGNKIRKSFEQLLHDLSVELSIGFLEETRNIIDRIANSETVYWKRNSTLQELVSKIENLIPSITDVSIRNEFKDLIGLYKLKKAKCLKDTICSLKLYQKISMHPLSHGVVGVPHFTKKDVRQSLILLEKLEKCVHSIEDGKI